MAFSASLPGYGTRQGGACRSTTLRRDERLRVSLFFIETKMNMDVHDGQDEGRPILNIPHTNKTNRQGAKSIRVFHEKS